MPVADNRVFSMISVHNVYAWQLHSIALSECVIVDPSGSIPDLVMSALAAAGCSKLRPGWEKIQAVTGPPPPEKSMEGFDEMLPTYVAQKVASLTTVTAIDQLTPSHGRTLFEYFLQHHASLPHDYEIKTGLSYYSVGANPNSFASHPHVQND